MLNALGAGSGAGPTTRFTPAETVRSPAPSIAMPTTLSVVGAVPAGITNVNVESFCAPAVVASHTVCYDMSYSKTATPFVTWAVEQGCARAHKGWGMLVEQAAESFTLWRGVRPDTEPVLAALGIK